MPVEGPVGVRSMDWMNGKKLVSPLHSKYTWEESIQWAECNCTGAGHWITPPYDPIEFPCWPDKILRMSFSKNCGIWAATNILIIHSDYADYQNASVLFLCEALGSVMLYTEGWRASGVELFAVVKPQFFNKAVLGTYHPYEMRMKAAAEFFHIPIVPEAVAEKTILIQMEKYLKGDVYDYADGSKDPFNTNTKT